MVSLGRGFFIFGLGLVAVIAGGPAKGSGLAGTWTVKVKFKSGAFAAVKDLEFLTAFNEGGTMTESSNYDGAPPVPPAYGIWRKTGADRYEAKYVFFNSKPPARFEEISGGGGWGPAGRGVLMEKIFVSRDSYDSTITLEMIDPSGKHSDGGRAVAHGVRMKF
jgi:hypothetical protein